MRWVHGGYANMAIAPATTPRHNPPDHQRTSHPNRKLNPMPDQSYPFTVNSYSVIQIPLEGPEEGQLIWRFTGPYEDAVLFIQAKKSIDADNAPVSNWLIIPGQWM